MTVEWPWLEKEPGVFEYLIWSPSQSSAHRDHCFCTETTGFQICCCKCGEILSLEGA